METDRLAALIADLDHSDKPILRRAVDELIARAAAPEVYARLERRLAEPDHRNYWPVAYILGHLPQPSTAAIHTLITALDHGEPDIRWACALLLTQISRSESAVIALLIDLCRGGTANQKRMALYCLRDLESKDPVSLQALLDALSDTDCSVRVAAAISLKIGSDGGEVVRRELLKSYMNDSDNKVRSAAAVTLARFGSPSDLFLSELKKNLESGNSQARKAAAVALRCLQKK